VPLPDKTVGFDRIVRILISVFDKTDILAPVSKRRNCPDFARLTTLVPDGEQSLGQLVDACVYLGMTPDVETVVIPAGPSLPVVLPPDR
jgi:hypothetical protein